MWTTTRRIAENLAGVFLGVLVTIALRHDLILGCILGLAVCLVVIVVCARFEGRLKRKETSQRGFNLTAKGVVSKPPETPETNPVAPPGSGFVVANSQGITMTGNTARGNKGDGFHFGPGVTANLERNEAIDNEGTGFMISGSPAPPEADDPMSESRARWDAAMEVARARSDYYATLASDPDPATPNPPPDFDPERREYREVMINCDGNGQVWEPVIHSLIVRTRAKIEAWNPRHVARFDDPDITDVTLNLMDSMVHPNEIPTLRDLRQRFERLDRILGL